MSTKLGSTISGKVQKTSKSQLYNGLTREKIISQFGSNHLVEKPSSIPWTPPEQYPELIHKFSGLYGWGLSGEAIDRITKVISISDHKYNPLMPFCIDLSFKQDPYHYFKKAVAFLGDRLNEIGCRFRVELLTEPVISTPYEDRRYNYPKIGTLDFQSYQIPSNDASIMFADFNRRSSWPGIEVLMAFGFSPKALLKMCEDNVNILIPGIIIDSEHMAYLSYSPDRNIAHLATVWTKTPLNSKMITVAFARS